LGAAAVLVASGREVIVWSPSLSRTTLTPALSREPEIEIEASGVLSGRYQVGIAAQPEDAVLRSDVVMLALPGNYHRRVMDTIAPHLRAGQTVLMSGHLSFGALHLSRLLAGRGVEVPIVVWGTTVTTGRRSGAANVTVNNVREQVDVAVVPDGATAAGVELCRTLFGDRFREREGLLAIALSNVNPQNHMAIALCNLTRMERGETWRQASNTTDAVGRLIEALDAERLAIAEAVGVQVRTVRQHFALSFGVAEGPIGAMSAAMAAGGRDTVAPATLDTRYVLEDVPFGLYATVRLGALAGRPAVLHEAGLALFSALYGRDLAADNDLLPAIGFDGLDLPALQRMSRAGSG
jgi:opine dehydrogenase